MTRATTNRLGHTLQIDDLAPHPEHCHHCLKNTLSWLSRCPHRRSPFSRIPHLSRSPFLQQTRIDTTSTFTPDTEESLQRHSKLLRSRQRHPMTARSQADHDHVNHQLRPDQLNSSRQAISLGLVTRRQPLHCATDHYSRAFS